MSRHSTPAFARACRIATAPISIAVVSPNRPKGCSPTPMIATSSTAVPLSAHRPKRESHHVVAVVVAAEGHDHQLHLHSDAQRRGIGLRQPRFDLHLIGQLDVANAK